MTRHGGQAGWRGMRQKGSASSSRGSALSHRAFETVTETLPCLRVSGGCLRTGMTRAGFCLSRITLPTLWRSDCPDPVCQTSAIIQARDDGEQSRLAAVGMVSSGQVLDETLC